MPNSDVQSLEKIIQFITSGLEQYESIKIESNDSLLCVSKYPRIQYSFFFCDLCTIDDVYHPQSVRVPEQVVDEFKVLINTIDNYVSEHKEIRGIEGEFEDTYFFEYKGNIYSYVCGLLGGGIVKTEETEDISLYKTGYTKHIIKFNNLNQYYMDTIKIEKEGSSEKNKIKSILPIS